MARKTTTAINTETAGTVQEAMFRTLLKTPHRQIDETLSIHREQFERDPDFYGHLAAWAVAEGNNTIRDVNNVFIAVLFASPYEEHRRMAYSMLQFLPPFEVVRVCDIFTGWEEIVRHCSYSKKPLPVNGQFGVTVERAKFGKSHAQSGTVIPVNTVTVPKNQKLRKELIEKGLSATAKTYTVTAHKISHEGLGKRHLTGLLKEAVRAYLRLRERPENRSMMEGALLRAKDDMRRLYYRSNTLPCGDEGSWINRYVFRQQVEPGTRLAALQAIRMSKDPAEQSALIMEHKIPYPVASSVISNMTPSILVALINAMSAQELLANLDALQRRGAMDNADLKTLIQAKLKDAKTAKRVDALKGGVAVKAAKNLDDDIRKAVVEVTDTQLKKIPPINCRVGLLIDKSGSMERAIEFGKDVAAAIAQACTKYPPVVYVFDTYARNIVWSAADGDQTLKSSWDKKLKMIKADGGTAPSSCVRSMEDAGVVVDELIVVTDEGENSGPLSFASSVMNYEKKIGIKPFVFILRVPSGYGVQTKMTKDCEAKGIEVEAIDCTQMDKVSMPNLIQRLARKSMLEFMQEIMACKLPTRDEWLRKQKMTSAEIKKGLAALAPS